MLQLNKKQTGKIALIADESRLHTIKRESEAAVKPYQLLLNEFLSFRFPIKIETIGDLTNLAKHGEKYVKQKLEDVIEPREIAGLQMKKSAIVESLDLPSFQKLNDLAKQVTGEGLRDGVNHTYHAENLVIVKK